MTIVVVNIVNNNIHTQIIRIPEEEREGEGGEREGGEIIQINIGWKHPNIGGKHKPMD